MKGKNWFEKIDSTTRLPNLYPYAGEVEQSDKKVDGILTLVYGDDNVIDFSNWLTDEQIAV